MHRTLPPNRELRACHTNRNTAARAARWADLAAFAPALILVLRRGSRGARLRVLESLGHPSPFWVVAGVAVALLGWVLIVAGLAQAGVVTESAAAGTCQYYLNNHGQKMCITRREYDVQATKEQAMGFGAAAFFLGVAVVAVAGKQDPTDDR